MKEKHTKPKKSLGQHFLKSSSALRKIADATLADKGASIVEIGPGEGALTAVLLQTGAKVTAIEKDRSLCALLEERFAEEIASGQLRIKHADALECEWHSEAGEGKWILAGNIPYYITGAIIRKTFEEKILPERAVFLVQKEVAERAVARDGKQSILSLAIGAYGKAKIVSKVPRGAFHPMPKVDSAILLVENISRDFFKGFSEEVFFQKIKAAFSSKRKLAFRNLGLSPQEAEIFFPKAGIPVPARAEDISLHQWGRLLKVLN